MDPFLFATNFLVAGIGTSIFLASIRINRRWLQGIVQTFGVILILAAALTLPSRAVQSINEDAEATAPTDDDSSALMANEDGAVITDEESGNTVIITRDKSLVELLRRAIQDQTQQAAPATALDETDEEEFDSDDRPERDPFGPAHIAVEDDVVEPTPTPAPSPEPTPTPAPTPIPVPARERTLPQEDGGTPACTSFALLHGKSGGPEPDGCYAVGCQEGYALPMQLIGGAWNQCENYSRLPRLGNCYIVIDHDGTQRSMRFNKGSWKPGTCS